MFGVSYYGQIAFAQIQAIIALAVGVITGGTVTAATIHVSATDATWGFPAYSYQWAISPHGANTYTNFGTNSLTGQTATGLTAANSYDIRLTYTDAALNTAQTFLTNVSTAGAAAAMSYGSVGDGVQGIIGQRTGFGRGSGREHVQ
jgi:hypothetical protein